MLLFHKNPIHILQFLIETLGLHDLGIKKNALTEVNKKNFGLKNRLSVYGIKF